ncbi:MAG: hypothetical protein Q3962_09390 [Corynebacterium sp.]|nr:hypothetical protein [Corynebacterium sp.]
MAKIFRRVIITIIVILIVLALIVEIGGRMFISRAMHDEASGSMSLGSSSIIMAAATGKVKEVEIHNPSSLQISYPNGGDNAPEITGAPAMDITLKGYHLYGDKKNTVDHMKLTTTLDNDLLLAMIQTAVGDSLEQALGGDQDNNQQDDGSIASALSGFASGLVAKVVKISGVETDPSKGTVTVQITNGLAELTLNPTVKDGKLDFGQANVSVFGMNLPDSVSEKITNGLEQATSQLNTELAFTDLQIQGNGISVTLEGDNVDFEQNNQGVNLSDITSESSESAHTSTAQTTAAAA